MIQNRLQLRRCQTIVQRQQNGTQPCQRKQQHQHGWIVQAHVGHAVSLLHPIHLQHGCDSLYVLPELAVADVFTLKMQGALIGRRPGVPRDDVG